MRFKVNFHAPTLDLAAYKAELNSYMEEWLKQAGREWLNATVMTVIPTWSKASRATFQKLASELGTSIPYGPLRSQKDRESLGLSTGSQSGLELNPSGGQWHFKYHSSLRYLAYNEYNRAVFGEGGVLSRSGLRHPTPYHFQEKGLQAFEDFTRFTELPNPFRFLKKGKLT